MPYIETIENELFANPRSPEVDPFDPASHPFYSLLFASFRQHNIECRALHAQAHLLHGFDLAVHPRDIGKLPLIFAEVARLGYRIVQSVDIASARRRFVFASLESPEVKYFLLDVVRDGNSLSGSSSPSSITRHFPGVAGKGLFLVFLGPDGVGKTTLLRYLSTALGPLFAAEVMYRWRPGFFMPTQHPSCLPHAKPPRGLRRSISYIAFSWCDFVAGYLFKTRQMLREHELVVFDRYYHDLLVDPKRYRYDGPMWLAKMVGRLMPSRDILFMILDADENAVFARKQQLPLEEIKRQRAAYCDFARSRENSVLIRTDQPIEECRRQALTAVLHHLAERNDRSTSVRLRSRMIGNTSKTSQVLGRTGITENTDCSQLPDTAL